MAHAEKLVKSWRVHYQLPNGKWDRLSGFPTKSAALKKGRELEAQAAAGTYVDPRKAQTPFGVWAPIWMEAQAVDPNTVARRKRHLKLLLPHWQDVPLCEINLFTAKAWANKQTHDPVTVGHALTLLSMMLTGAADADYLTGNPLARRQRTGGSNRTAEGARKRVAKSKADEVWAHPEDVRALYERLGGVPGLMVLTAAYTGLRWGELTGIHQSNCLQLRRDRLPDGKYLTRRVIRIDPDVGTLHEVEFELSEEELAAWRVAEDARIAKGIAAGRTPKRKKEPEARVRMYLGPPKNEKSAREVDVPPFLAELLAVHMAVWPSEYPFTTPGKSPTWWRRGNFGRSHLRPAADGRTALKASRGHAPREAWAPILPGLTMRGLRHTHSTWMKEDKIDRALRFERMGWVVDDIEGTYEHVTPQMRKELLDALQARWTRSREAATAVS